MRRRRKKNTLLTRIILVSLAVHAIALPVAAHFGAFDKIRHEFGSSKVVMVSVPPLDEKKRATKKEKAPKKSSSTAKKGHSSSRRSSRANSRPNPFQPKVIASAGGDSQEGSSPTVDPNGAGTAGVLPTGPATAAPPITTTTSNAPTRETSAPAPSAPATVPVASITPRTEVPAAKKFVQVETTYAPEPTIPDDLRAEPLDKTLVVEADVSTSGLPENVRVAESTGNHELDGIGLDTAKHYKFKPATLGDEPVEGHVRFRIIFKVE